jgi:hypothetical protein
MKMMLLCLLVALPCILTAEEFVAPQAPRREISPQASELNPSIEGMVKFFLSSKKPWQALNPAAPAQYGTGEKNISKDSAPGTPHHATTLTIIGLEW